MQLLQVPTTKSSTTIRELNRNKVIIFHMRQVSGLGIWRRVECRALQRYGGNNIKVQSAQ